MSMNESDAVEFFDELVNGSQSGADTEQYILEADSGQELTVQIEQLDRAYVIDKLNELPEEMLGQMEDVENPEQVDEEEVMQQADGMGGIDGDAIRAFEELCAEGLEHPHLTTHEFQEIAHELSLEVLFEIGGRIIEMSLEQDGRVTGFRKHE